MNNNFKIQLWALIMLLVSCNNEESYKIATLKYYGKNEIYDSINITDVKDLELIKNSLVKLKPGIAVFQIDYILEIKKNDEQCIKIVGNYEGSLFRDSVFSYHLMDKVARNKFISVLNKYIGCK